jgi:hypothetical protein
VRSPDNQVRGRRRYHTTARDVCEQAFSFLVDEFGYRRCGRRFLGSGGFEIDYRGSLLGVRVYWYQRDPLTVWLVRLREGRFPRRPWYLHDGPYDYFDLGDLTRVVTSSRHAHGDFYVPSAENAAILADDLRECGADLLRDDLSVLPSLEERIRDRVRRDRIRLQTGGQPTPPT